jgi:hypothetical protein
MITGMHAILYTSEPDELRAIFSDVFGFSHVDAGHGWLIFAFPPSELGIHPADGPGAELSLMCDDLAQTMTELQGRGITFKGEPADQGWGVVATMELPGGVDMMLYEPRHPTAH